MSVIVVIKKNGKTVIGCDSKFSEENLISPSNEKTNWDKLHKTKHSFIGHVGESAYHTVLDYATQNHSNIFNFEDRMSTFKSMLKLQEVLVDECMLKPTQDEFLSSGLNLLVATANSIFTIDTNRGVDEYERFWAIGSGSKVALGAIEVLYDKEDDPKDIAAQALKAACKYDLHCNETYHIETIH